MYVRKINTMLQRRKKIGLVGVTMAVFVVSQLVGRSVLVNAMSSTNYSVVNDSLNFGGGAASSASYDANDTLGDVATGEGLTSENYGGCSGFQCYSDSEDFLSFSVKQGTASPGIAGAGVAFGDLELGTIASSDGSDVNSIFIVANSNADSGFKVTVTSENEGLAKLSAPSVKIDSSSATLSAGTEGYGVCVESVAESGDSPTTFEASTPYNGSCDKINNHEVGLVDSSFRTILESIGRLRGGSAEILVKTAISTITPAGSDYGDTLTFIATPTY